MTEDASATNEDVRSVLDEVQNEIEAELEMLQSMLKYLDFLKSATYEDLCDALCFEGSSFAIEQQPGGRVVPYHSVAGKVEQLAGNKGDFFREETVQFIVESAHVRHLVVAKLAIDSGFDEAEVRGAMTFLEANALESRIAEGAMTPDHSVKPS